MIKLSFKVSVVTVSMSLLFSVAAFSQTVKFGQKLSDKFNSLTNPKNSVVKGNKVLGFMSSVPVFGEAVDATLTAFKVGEGIGQAIAKKAVGKR